LNYNYLKKKIAYIYLYMLNILEIHRYNEILKDKEWFLITWGLGSPVIAAAIIQAELSTI
jgi:hypothetical protein